MESAHVAAPPVHAVPEVEVDEAALTLLDEAALTCIRQVVAWSREHAPEHQVHFVRARVRRWQSVEDPEWIQLKLDMWVAGEPDAALAFADEVDDRLRALAEGQRTPATELLMLSMHWR